MKKPYLTFRGHYALSVILRKGWPRMTARQAAENATQIMDALYAMGLEILPRTNPPSDADELQQAVDRVVAKIEDRDAPARHVRRDAFDGFDDLLAEMEDRSPWNPPELN